jgi:hypothetical protein
MREFLVGALAIRKKASPDFHKFYNQDVRRAAESLRAPHEDFNGEAFLIVPG